MYLFEITNKSYFIVLQSRYFTRMSSITLSRMKADHKELLKISENYLKLKQEEMDRLYQQHRELEQKLKNEYHLQLMKDAITHIPSDERDILNCSDKS